MAKNNVFEVKLTFPNDSNEMSIRDRNLFKKIPLLIRAVASQFPEWETQDTIVPTPLQVPFARQYVTFLLSHIRYYQSPETRGPRVETTADTYSDAKRKSLDELKFIIELANFLECTEFVQCMGVVIADKLSDMDVTQIAEYMGLEVIEDDDGYDEDSEWMHPPLATFRQVEAPVPREDEAWLQILEREREAIDAVLAGAPEENLEGALEVVPAPADAPIQEAPEAVAPAAIAEDQ